MSRKSKWTSIYWGSFNNSLRPFVRITPEILELEKLGFPHGIGINMPFTSEKEANDFADIVDQLFDALQVQIIEDYKNDSKCN